MREPVVSGSPASPSTLPAPGTPPVDLPPGGLCSTNRGRGFADPIVCAALLEVMAAGKKRLATAGCLALLAFGGCAAPRPMPAPVPPSPAPTAAAPQVDAAPPVAAAATGPTVTLLAAGANARQPLRYRPSADASETGELDLVSGVDLALGELHPTAVRTPSVRLTLALRRRGGDDGGRLVVEAKVTKADVLPGSGPAAVADTVREDLQAIAGWTFQVTFDERGLPAALMTDTRDVPPPLAALRARLEAALRGLLIPLPDEPVGTGARWEVRGAVRVGPVTADDRVEVQLVELGPSRARVAFKATRSAGAQPLAVEGLPPGAALTLQELSGAGQGRAELRLGHLLQPGGFKMTSGGTGTARLRSDPPASIKLTLEESTTWRAGR